MPDVFSVTASWDKPSYNAGDTITGTISGNDVSTVTTTSTKTVGPVTVPVVAADGAQSTVSIPAVPVTVNTVVTAPESVVIDTSRPIVDTSGRTWVVSASKLSISAIA